LIGEWHQRAVFGGRANSTLLRVVKRFFAVGMAKVSLQVHFFSVSMFSYSGTIPTPTTDLRSHSSVPKKYLCYYTGKL
jgi:hypothetical protein